MSTLYDIGKTLVIPHRHPLRSEKMFQHLMGGKGKSSRRPKWAGSVHVGYEGIQNPLHGARDTNLTGFFRAKLPVIRYVSGLLLPLNYTNSSTTRGSMLEPFGINLKRTGYDRGHLMAISLGGPDSPYNLVPQESRCNQKMKQQPETITLPGTGTWRATEVFLSVMSYQVLKHGLKPVTTGKVDVLRTEKGSSIKVAGGTVFKDKLPAPEGWRLRKSVPEQGLWYSAFPHYEATRWPDNAPTGVHVVVHHIDAPNNTISEVYNWFFDWPTPSYAPTSIDQYNRNRKVYKEEERAMSAARAAARRGSRADPRQNPPREAKRKSSLAAADSASTDSRTKAATGHR